MKNYIKENSISKIRPTIEKLSETELRFLKRLLDDLNKDGRNNTITEIVKTETKLEVTTTCINVFVF